MGELHRPRLDDDKLQALEVYYESDAGRVRSRVYDDLMSLISEVRKSHEERDHAVDALGVVAIEAQDVVDQANDALRWQRARINGLNKVPVLP